MTYNLVKGTTIDTKIKANLYLFPHQDDEAMVFEKLREDLKKGIKPLCLFLTTNSELKMAHRRQRESQNFLNSLGVANENIFFLGQEFQVFDNHLMYQLEKLESSIQSKFSNLTIDSVIAPAYEGGHHDHDTAFCLGYRLSQFYSARLFQYWCYNGADTKLRFFRVRKPILNPKTSQTKLIAIKRSLKDFLRTLLIPYFYPSQAKSWLGLYPDFIFNSFFRQIYLTEVFEFDLDKPPHSGVLLYERWRRTTYVTWKNCMLSYLKKNL